MYNEPFDLGSTNTVCNDEICSSDSKRFKAMTSVIGMTNYSLNWNELHAIIMECVIYDYAPPPLHSEYESTSSLGHIIYIYG